MRRAHGRSRDVIISSGDAPGYPRRGEAGPSISHVCRLGAAAVASVSARAEIVKSRWNLAGAHGKMAHARQPGFCVAPVSRILITSGPTRQYLDAVRYLTNASSGRMGQTLCQAMLELGHEVVVVSGPVDVDYPAGAEVVDVVSTEEMLAACGQIFPTCDGLIGVAAPCDYRPVRVATGKIQKTGQPLELRLIETPDVVATLGGEKRGQWLVGFALETDDQRLRALAKLEKKSCDLMVLNGPEAMHAVETRVEIIDRHGTVLETLSGPKETVARGIAHVIEAVLIRRDE